MMLLKRGLLLILLLLVLSSCQPTMQQTEQEGTLHVREIPLEKKQTTKTAEIDEHGEGEVEKNIEEIQEQVVTLGMEGFTEDVRVRRFENDWLSMWVDASLTMQKQEDQVEFSQEDSNLVFSVQRLDADSAAEQAESLIEELLYTGYELIDEFLIEHRQGKGSILYSYEERLSVDIYLLEETPDHLLVSFVIPDTLMDRFVHRFEYMLHSIELLS